MKLKDFIKFLQAEAEAGGADLNVELTKVLSINDRAGPYELTLDFPIIGIARRKEDLYLVIEAAAEMIAFGKDIKRMDGKPLTAVDIDLIRQKE